MTLVGQQIGRYRVLEQVGTGGMSVVYKGLDTALGREVAIKVLHTHLAQRGEARARLAREARAVAKLHHRNILEVFDVSAEGSGEAFLVTEFIRGKTLREFAQGERFHPPELAAMAVHELAAALAHAHDAGVIHRDIKPENVMVRSDGVLKLMDFGIAKLMDRDERMTQTGALVGSPAHMAPEIIEGEEAGPAADIFSLGTILYWLATAELPFTAPNTTATLKRILDGTYEDPRTRNGAVSEELASIIARCLAREPLERFPDARALEGALAQALARVGLERPHEELEAFLVAPVAYREELKGRLIVRYLGDAEALIHQGRPARALTRLDQVLALSPTDERALGLLKQVNRRRRTERRLKRAGGALAGLLLMAALIGGARGLLRDRAASRARSAVATPSAAPPTQAEARPAPAQVERSRDPGPAGERAANASPASALAHRPKARAVPVQVLVRPYGYVQLDDEPRSAEALAQHSLLVIPGKHRLTVSCEACEPWSETVEVTQQGDNNFALPAQPKPARVSFAYEPKGALVTVGAESRTAESTLKRPFEVRVPRGPTSFQLPVEFEVKAEGFRPEHGHALLVPGRTTVIRGSLERG